MTPRTFLAMASVVLITIGTLGVVGVLGELSPASFFHPPYWINWFHLGLGIFVLGVMLWGERKLQARVTLLATVMGLTLGLSGLLFGPWSATHFRIPELADPSDHVAHLTVGLVALWGWLRRKDNQYRGGE